MLFTEQSIGLYLLISGILFSIGLIGVLIRRNLIVILMCLELMLSACIISLVAFSRCQHINNSDTLNLVKQTEGQILVLFIMTVAAAEVAIGLGIIVAFKRAGKSLNINEISVH